MIVSTALVCMALNIYHEARGEQVPGQYAVALVTMNRAGTPERVCDTVFRRKQFSWANRAVKRDQAGWRIGQGLIPRELEAWERAQIIAGITLAGRMSDFTQGSTHYHARWVRPYWSSKLERTRAIGGHVFYRSASQS